VDSLSILSIIYEKMALNSLRDLY